MKVLAVFLSFFFLVVEGFAGSVPKLDNITDAQLDTIASEFSSLFVHTSVTPPTSMGKVFGAEAAVIAGAVEIPGLEEISKQVDPASDLSVAPFAMLYGSMSVPYGVTIETNILPGLDISGLELSHYGAGVKWSLSDSILPGLPFDLAVKSYYSKSKIGYSQSIPGANVDVAFENNMLGAETLFGVDLMVVEPYAGLGFVRSSSELRGSAAANPAYSMFADNVSRSKKANVESARIIVGCQFNLALFQIGLEYNHVFDNNRFAIKTGMSF